jgi:hypothetical protein
MEISIIQIQHLPQYWRLSNPKEEYSIIELLFLIEDDCVVILRIPFHQVLAVKFF